MLESYKTKVGLDYKEYRNGFCKELKRYSMKENNLYSPTKLYKITEIMLSQMERFHNQISNAAKVIIDISSICVF
jgi:hypothetical protein